VALVDQRWRRIGIHNVISEFLRAETDTIFNFHRPWLPLIDHPNLDDPLENHKRMRLLYIQRARFLIELPPDTVWYEVGLTDKELDELYLSARHNPTWDSAGNKLGLVAETVKEPLKVPPNDWPGRIILWGHQRTGPFSIIEGNHRMLAYACSNPRPLLDILVYVGLSRSYCYWHRPDPACLLGNDLFRPQVELAESNDWLWVRVGST
jgi:hypothetical protein